MWDMATPVTFHRHTGNWRGSYEGWLPTPEVINLRMSKTLPGLDNFYMAGQLVEPDVGVTALSTNFTVSLQNTHLNTYNPLNNFFSVMLKIGHRGASAYELENTLSSFQMAIELGVDAVELDIRSTRDGAIVVIHDENVDRTTNGTGSVRGMTLEEIKGLLTRNGEKIPTLEEALDFLDKRVKILIELKDGGLEEKTLDLVRKKGLERNVIIISFLEGALRRVRELDKDIETGLIYVRHSNPIKAALNLGANYLLPLYRFLHKEDIDTAHEHGLKVITWTINSREDALIYAKRGVDGIASDKPDILTL